MINRRTALGLIASAGAMSASDFALAKEKHHLNGNSLLAHFIREAVRRQVMGSDEAAGSA
jgi:hypothetical protein